VRFGPQYPAPTTATPSGFRLHLHWSRGQFCLLMIPPARRWGIRPPP